MLLTALCLFLTRGAVAGEASRSIGLLQVGDRGAHGRSAWPQPFALPLPQGFIASDERIALLAGGREREALIEAWSRHPDGSPHWVRVAPAPWPAGIARAELRALARGAANDPAAGALESGGSGLAAPGDRTGAATVTFARDLTVRCGGSSLCLELSRMRLFEHGAAVTAIDPSPPLRVGRDGGACRFEWRATLGDAGSSVAFATARVAAAGDGSRVEVELLLEAAREVVIESWRVQGQLGGDSLESRRGAAVQKPAKDGRRTALALRPGDPLAVGETFDESTEPWSVRVGISRHSIALHWPDFGVARPSSASLQKSGGFDLRLVARPLLLRAGQVVRRTLRIATGADSAEFRSRPRLVEAERAGSGGGGLAGAELRSREAAVIDRWVKWLAAGLERPQRLDDRGCYALQGGDFANGEYDLGGSLLELGAASREAQWIEVGAALSRHTLDWDRTHEPGNTVPAGLFAQHGKDHASGRVEAGHQWIGGALGLARRDGDIAAFEAARTTVAALAAWRKSRPERFDGPERRIAWPLHAALDLDAAMNEPPARRFASELVAGLAARRHPEGFLDGDRRPVAGGHALWVNSWVALGISVTALERAACAGDPQAATVATALGGAVVVAAELPDGGFAEVVTVDPDSGVAVRRGAPLSGGEAALASAGLRALAAVAGPKARPEWARRADSLDAAAWAFLESPAAERTIDLAKALQALRFDRDRERRSARQSRIDPSSLR